jgi:hypothetical protein
MHHNNAPVCVVRGSLIKKEVEQVCICGMQAPERADSVGASKGGHLVKQPPNEQQCMHTLEAALDWGLWLKDSYNKGFGPRAVQVCTSNSYCLRR